MNILLILIGYSIGNINPAYIISKVKNTNISKVGSNNPGASNITMTFGWKLGIVTAFTDILKAFLPVLIIKLLGYTDIELLIFGTSIIIGHIYPVVFKFKGGKGTASFIGMILAISPLHGFFIGLILVIGTVITDYIALGTIFMMSGYLIFNLFQYSTEYFFISAIIPILSYYKHFPNIIKIIDKTESGLRGVLKKWCILHHFFFEFSLSSRSFQKKKDTNVSYNFFIMKWSSEPSGTSLVIPITVYPSFS